jgi:hypothetical protein
MATTQLDRIELALANLAADLAAVRSLIQQIFLKEINMATNQEALAAALAQLNTTTSQEAALLAADTGKLDAIKALIDNLISTAGVPQSVLDLAAQIQATVDGVVATTTAQASRLDQLATDPRNPVPVPPPAPTA